MTNVVEVVHAWSGMNETRFVTDGVSSDIPPISTFSTGQATRFVLKRGSLKLQVFAWDTGDFVVHTEDSDDAESKQTLAIKIKSGEDAIPIIEERYSKTFGKPHNAQVSELAGTVVEELMKVAEPEPVVELATEPLEERKPSSVFELAKEKSPPRHFCLVCGYDGLRAAPIDENGIVNSEICPCCGYQFGYDDQQRGISYEAARNRWIGAGMPWFSQSVTKPRTWDGSAQLKRITRR